jgi:valyl-tRNA synthetase
LAGNDFCAVVKFVVAVFVGQGVAAQLLTQPVAERLYYREDDTARRSLDGVAFDEVELTIGIGLLIVVQTVEVHHLQDGGLLEKFFWNFCDNYIEIVKHRLYRPEEFGDTPRYSGQKTVYIILYKLLQDFSIYFPYITEEIYQELYHDNKSIHITEIKPLNYSFDNEIKNGDLIIDIISQARGEKSINNISLKTPIKNLDLSLDNELKDAINKSIKDFKATLFINNLIINDCDKDYMINKIELDLSE